MAELSDGDKRNVLQTSLTKSYGLDKNSPIPSGVYIEEVFETELVYSIDSQYYKAVFEIDETGAVKIGDPEKVSRQVVYPTAESLQAVYQDVIYEAGKRNAIKDATRLKTIMSLIQELLDSENPDKEELKRATSEANATLAWIRTIEADKTEDGQVYPMSAFAYVPDSEKSSTWKLRLWASPEDKVTKAQLGAAAAAFSPGGFRGQKVDIPAEDIAAVKRKIRSEYHKLGVEEDEMPNSVKESTSRVAVVSYVPFLEAIKVFKGRASIIVIKPGFNVSEDRYYPVEMLKRDYGIFEGQKMYADHPTDAEDKARPERSIRDWVATLVDVSVDESGWVHGIAEIHEEWVKEKLESLSAKGMLEKMGISINAVGSATKGKIDGKDTLIVEKLVAARSVDFVTEPGAGGIVTFYESVRGYDVDLIELSELAERRPDLVLTIEATVRSEISKEAKQTMAIEDTVKDLEKQVETLTTQNEAYKEAEVVAAKAKAKDEAQAAIKEAVEKSELPVKAKEKMMQRWADSETSEGIKESIQSEADYIATLSESSKVRGMGPSELTPASEKEKLALRESFKRTNPTWTDEQLDTAVNGR